MLSFAATVLLDGISYGMVLFLISVGLTITMGLMRVVNLAHGSFAMIGGYTAGYLTQKGVNFYVAIAGAMAVAGVLGGVAEITLYRPLYGARLRAAVDNSKIARCVGMNVNVLFTGTFIIGCALAGLGGAVGAHILSLEPSYALKYVVLFLVVVIVGGEGSFKGSFVAAIALGIIDTLGKYFVTQAAPYLLYAAVFVLLLWRPQGLMPSKAAA